MRIFKILFRISTIIKALMEYFSLKNKMLLQLTTNWTSGTKTVPNIHKYQTIEVFPYDNLGGIVCHLEPDGYFRGSGFCQGASSQFVQFEFALTFTNNSLSISSIRYTGHLSGSNHWAIEGAWIRQIKGLEPKIPESLQDILNGGGYLTYKIFPFSYYCEGVAI